MCKLLNIDYRLLILRYFLEYVCHKIGTAQRIRADCGNENGTVKEVQIFLRTTHVDTYAGERSFLFGPSTSN